MATNTPNKFKVAGKTFTSYDEATDYAFEQEEEVMVYDPATRNWREVANCEIQDDEN